MARIAGVDLPKEKRVEIGLTYIYGIGVASSNKILAKAGVNPDTRVKDLTEADVAAIRTKQIIKYVLMLNTLPLAPIREYSEIRTTLPTSWNVEIFEYKEQIKRRNQKINTLREKLLMPVNCYPYRSI